MTRDPKKVVLLFASMIVVWGVVYWVWKPPIESNLITFGSSPDLAAGLVEVEDSVPLPKAVETDDLPFTAPPIMNNVLLVPEPRADETRLPDEPSQTVRRLIPPEFRDYTVARGDTSWEAISQRVYGTSRHAGAISRANPFVSPHKLVVGKTKLRLPVDPTNVQGKVEEVKVPRAATLPAAVPSNERQSAQENLDEARTHTVRSGETLTGISKKYYGTTQRWKDILAANKRTLPSAERLRMGMELVIP